MGNRLGADIDLWPTRDWTLISVGFIDHIELTDNVFLALDLPWAYGASHPGGDGFTLGNPTVGVYYATRLGNRAAFYIGGTATPPLHIDGDGPGDTGVARTAALARALDDLHRFWPNHVYLRMLLGFEIGVRPVFLKFDFTPVFWIPIPDEGDDPEFVLEHATELEILANMGLGGGGRFQAVFFPTERFNRGPGSRDYAQLGVEPFFAYEPEPRGFFARAGVLFGVDPPLGPPFDRNNVVTIRGTLGGKW
jgi:hypothetical protein